MGGSLRGGVGLLAIAIGVLAAVGPASAQTYSVGSTPYSSTTTLLSTDGFDSHELNAPSGRQISYTARATAGGCILVLFTLGHNVNDQSLYLPAYSQESCVPSFSKSYTVPSGGGPEFSIVITTEIAGDVAYQLDITTSTPNPIIGILSGIAVLVVLGAIIGGISYAIRRRRRAAPPPIPQYAGYGQQPGMAPAQYAPSEPMAPTEPPQAPPPG